MDGQDQFEAWVADALDGLPPDIAALMDNVAIAVEQEPPPGANLLGLYRGVPQTRRTSGYAGALPDLITIYRGPLERVAGRDPERLRALIRRTVLHEIAHHFGISDERLRRARPVLSPGGRPRGRAPVGFATVAIIVQKYGGTSLAGPEEIKRVARRIVRTAEAGNSVCAVVSAMGQTTDELIGLARLVSSLPDPRELDMLLTAGERISMALVSMAINDLGHQAASFTGSQAGIVTDTRHGKARIVEMRRGRVHEALAANQIAIVAGFQGVSTSQDVTTLGRGGSDTTAVALAAALGAEVCEIYTDVDGVYSADPRIVPGARKREQVSFEEMLELAASGARVLALRSVEYARNHGVKIHVRSSFNESEGTWVIKEEEMEQAIISGVAHDTSEAKVTIRRVPDRPGVAGRTFRPLAEAGINIGEIVQNTSVDGLADISFTLPENELERAEPILEQLAEVIGAEGFTSERDIAKVSVIGAGMRSNPGVAAAIFEALADADINIEIISTSSIRVSCVVPAADCDRAVNVIHERLKLADVFYEDAIDADGG